MINESILETVRDQLSLRKLSLVNIAVKNKQTVKKIVIGFTAECGNLTFKVNCLAELPNKSLLEDGLRDYIVKQLENFNQKFAASVEHAAEILKDEHSAFSRDFKNSFMGAMSDYSTNETKLFHLQKAFKKADKKQKALEKVSTEEFKLKKIIDELQITDYHMYFDLARRFKRKLKLYIGPTNSGKTFHALNDLTSYKRGVYLSPLRLLAWEGKEEIEKRGFDCSLITGEERQITEGANFRSQTIETLNFSEEVDCIFIDEVQMLYDFQRAWAWTQGVIGAPCRQVIMAGSPESEPIVRKIAEMLGEELEVIRLERFNPLEVNEKHYELPRDLGILPEGTALIAFSRKKVLALKDNFESKNMPVSVIYGNLSPDVRREEARKFRDGETKFLIGTDSISMGLNLPISTIIFTATEKFNGTDTQALTAMQVKQIAGRAGRFGKVEKGSVSALHKEDLKFIRRVIQQPDETNNFLFIKPSIEHVKKIGEELKTEKLFPILTFFTNRVMSKVSHLYVCSDLEDQKEIALLLDKVGGLSLEDKFLFNNAPVPGDDHYQTYINWIRDYQINKIIPCPTVKILNPKVFNFDKQLIFENYVKLLNLYSWLSFKKPENFPDHDKCLNERDSANYKIEEFLKYQPV